MNASPSQALSAPGIDFITPWMSAEEIKNEPAAGGSSRHALFRELALQTMRAQCPWLLRILEGSGAQVLAMQGAFYVALRHAPTDWIEIPALSAYLRLVPWIEEGQIPQ